MSETLFYKSTKIVGISSIGIGTTNPASKISVYGNGSIGSGYSRSAAPSNGLLVEGSVGIATTNPCSTISVNGNGSIGSTYCSGVVAPENGLLVEGYVGIGTYSPTSTISVYGNGSIGSDYCSGVAAPSNGLIVQGSVGIGTDSPAASLHVAGKSILGPLGSSLTNIIYGATGLSGVTGTGSVVRITLPTPLSGTNYIPFCSISTGAQVTYTFSYRNDSISAAYFELNIRIASGTGATPTLKYMILDLN